MWKMGGYFCKKSGMGVCFVKKVDLSSTQGALCTVGYQYFLFYILLIWGGGAYAPNAPSAYGPVM